MNSKKSRFTAVFALFIFLTGCSTTNSPQSKIKENVIQTAALNRQAFSSIVDLNKTAQEEKKRFDQLINLKSADHAKANNLSKEAIKLAEQRKKELSGEEVLINKSRETMKNAKKRVSSIDDSQIKEAAGNMISASGERFEAIKEWHDAYLNAILEDEALYRMLGNPPVRSDQMEGQLEKVNRQYKVVAEKEKTINQLTKKFNEKKAAFFESLH